MCVRMITGRTEMMHGMKKIVCLLSVLCLLGGCGTKKAETAAEKAPDDTPWVIEENAQGKYMTIADETKLIGSKTVGKDSESVYGNVRVYSNDAVEMVVFGEDGASETNETGADLVFEMEISYNGKTTGTGKAVWEKDSESVLKLDEAAARALIDTCAGKNGKDGEQQSVSISMKNDEQNTEYFYMVTQYGFEAAYSGLH